MSYTFACKDTTFFIISKAKEEKSISLRAILEFFRKAHPALHRTFTIGPPYHQLYFATSFFKTFQIFKPSPCTVSKNALPLPA